MYIYKHIYINKQNVSHLYPSLYRVQSLPLPPHESLFFTLCLQMYCISYLLFYATPHLSLQLCTIFDISYFVFDTSYFKVVNFVMYFTLCLRVYCIPYLLLYATPHLSFQLCTIFGIWYLINHIYIWMLSTLCCSSFLLFYANSNLPFPLYTIFDIWY